MLPHFTPKLSKAKNSEIILEGNLAAICYNLRQYKNINEIVGVIRYERNNPLLYRER